MHFIYMLYTFYTSIHSFYLDFILVLDMLQTCFGHVPKKFWGSKMTFFQKFWGPLGYVLASSLVSKSRSKNQKSWSKIKKIKCFSEAPESLENSYALVIKFRALFSH